MVRLLNISDTHLQARQYYSEDRGADFEDAFRRAIGVGITLEMDAIVHTGDILDDHQPSEDAVIENAVEIVKSATAKGCRFLYLVGNHDRGFVSGEESRLFERLDDIDGVKRVGTDPTWVDDVVLYGVDHHYDDWWADRQLSFKAPSHEPSSVVLCFHQTAGPFREPDDCEMDLSTVLEQVPVPVDGVLMGHLHRDHVRSVGGIPCHYAGSPLRTHRGHANYGPGVLDLSLDSGGMTWNRLSLPARPFCEYTVVLDDDTTPDLNAVNVADGEVVTVNVATTKGAIEDYSARAREVKQSFATAGALDVSTRDRKTDLTGVAPGVYPGSVIDVADRHPEARYRGARTRERTGFLHVGGTFLGRWNLAPGRDAEFFRRFEEISHHASRSRVSTIVHSGNLFGTSSPDDEAVEDAREVLRVLQHDGVRTYHVPSATDDDASGTDRLIDAGLLTPLSEDPTIVEDDRIALYGAPPDPQGTLTVARSLSRTDATTSVFVTHVPVTPPAGTDEPGKRGPKVLSYDDLITALPDWVDLVCTGGVRHEAAYEGDPNEPVVVCAGEAERILGKYCFDAPPASGGYWHHHFGTDGWERTHQELDTHPVATVELSAGFDPDLDALAARIRQRVEIDDAIVIVGLTGERHAGAKLRREDFDFRLPSAYIVEVYDDREVPLSER